ncbi:MAG: hypothetical protein K6T17_05285 [Fimbriimonadales bacterium]|nr:hypothetical protein [Fimbriimonadales bacterium]
MPVSDKVRLALWWGVAVVLLVGAVMYVWQPFATRRVDRVAKGFLQAVFEGDGQRFYEFLHPVDQAELELTPEKCQHLLNEVVLPKFQGCRVVRWEPPIVDWENRFGSALVTLSCDGKPLGFFVNVGEMPGVGGTVRLGNFFNVLWGFEEIRRYGKVLEGREYEEMILEGIRRDKDKLEQIGIKGRATGKGYVLPWREWIADLERRIKEQRETEARVKELEKKWMEGEKR